MKTHSICHVPHHFYIDLILLVVGEHLKSLLLQPTRGLAVLFYISRILVQDSTRQLLDYTKKLTKNREFFLAQNCLKRIKSQLLEYTKKIDKKSGEKKSKNYFKVRIF